ncbi:hypothetical protein PMm318_A40610 [Pseudomonas moorei]
MPEHKKIPARGWGEEKVEGDQAGTRPVTMASPIMRAASGRVFASSVRIESSEPG